MFCPNREPTGIAKSCARNGTPTLQLAASRSLIALDPGGTIRCDYVNCAAIIAVPSVVKPEPDSCAFGPTLSDFLDDVYMRTRYGRSAMIVDEPPGLADQHEHAILAAVGEHLARRWSLRAAPAWTDDPSRFLHEPYFTTPIENLKAMLLARKTLSVPPPHDLHRSRAIAPRPDAW